MQNHFMKVTTQLEHYTRCTMGLPNFRKTVRIKFWSLRNTIRQSGGVCFDVDTKVERDVYRVRVSDGCWKWQIKGFNRLPISDWFAETDQECLDGLGSSNDFEYV